MEDIVQEIGDQLSLFTKSPSMKDSFWKFHQDAFKLLQCNNPGGFDMASMKARIEYNRRISYAPLGRKLVEKIATEWLPPGELLVSVAAGLGVWERVLESLYGMNVYCSDAGLGKYHNADSTGSTLKGAYTTVYVELGIETIRKMANPEKGALFLCWLPYQNTWDVKMLNLYHQRGGKRIILIGESDGGCTASEDFWDRLKELYSEVDYCHHPNLQGVHSYGSLWELRTDDSDDDNSDDDNSDDDNSDDDNSDDDNSDDDNNTDVEDDDATNVPTSTMTVMMDRLMKL